MVAAFAVGMVTSHGIRFYFCGRLVSLNSFGDDKRKHELERINGCVGRIKGLTPQLGPLSAGNRPRWLNLRLTLSSLGLQSLPACPLSTRVLFSTD